MVREKYGGLRPNTALGFHGSMARIPPTRSRLDLSPPNGQTRAPVVRPGGGLSFLPGDSFSGKVLSVLPESRAMLLVNGHQVEVLSTVPLKEGRSHQFLVQATGPGTLLRVLDAGGPGISPSLRALASLDFVKARIGSGLVDLMGHMASMSLTAKSRQILSELRAVADRILYRSGREDGGWVLKSLGASGVFWENKVARYLLDPRRGLERPHQDQDLKAILYRLAKGLGGEAMDAAEKRRSIQMIETMIQLIEKEQFISLSAQKLGWQWCWILPEHEASSFGGAEIFGGKGQEGEGIHLSIRLAFSTVGQVEAEVSLRGAALSIQITMEDHERLGAALEDLEDLKRRLEGLDMKVAQLSCEVRPQGQGKTTPSVLQDLEGAVHVVA
jgi:hypothetical protein